MRQTSGADLFVANGQPEPILPYEDVLSIRIVPARRIKYRVRRCIMKKYRERFDWEYSVLSIVGNADLSRPVCTGPVQATCVYLSRVMC
jgi:hypothetical protein